MSLDTLAQLLLSGLTFGAIYALATIGLSLIWGALGMLNMAHGVMLTVGGYAAYSVATQAGLPWPLAVLGALAAGAVVGALLYIGLTRWMVGRDGFETNIIIATFGVAIAIEAAILKIYGGRPFGQPLSVPGRIETGLIPLPWQNLISIAGALVLMVSVGALLKRSRIGRAVRAVSQQREAAGLMGVPVQQVYALVLVLSGMVAAVSGILLTTTTQLSPTLGQDPMIKAFIMCVVAGLGSISGSVIMAFALAMIEAVAQFTLGARFGLPALLTVVILVLIVRPAGLFGRIEVRRL